MQEQAEEGRKREEEKDQEIEKLEAQLNVKDAEITTVK